MRKTSKVVLIAAALFLGGAVAGAVGYDALVSSVEELARPAQVVGGVPPEEIIKSDEWLYAGNARQTEAMRNSSVSASREFMPSTVIESPSPDDLILPMLAVFLIFTISRLRRDMRERKESRIRLWVYNCTVAQGGTRVQTRASTIGVFSGFLGAEAAQSAQLLAKMATGVEATNELEREDRYALGELWLVHRRKLADRVAQTRIPELHSLPWLIMQERDGTETLPVEEIKATPTATNAAVLYEPFREADTYYTHLAAESASRTFGIHKEVARALESAN